jgi:lipopolysaccharide export system protein LptA
MKLKIKLHGKLQLWASSVLILACSHSSVYAAKTDFSREITIKSQRQSADLKNKIASYLDTVTISQGSILITADLVQVYTDNALNSIEKKSTYIASGNPAIFQQALEDGSLISLQADEIKYSPHLSIITMSGNAVVKQAGSEVSGSKITYNTLSEKLEAESKNNQAVTTILQPTVLKNKSIKDNE